MGGFFRHIARSYSPLVRNRGKVIKRFATKVGFVYFGSVDQHEDDHEVIRGLTVSTSHRDSHYAVGSYDGCDVTMVDRFDIIQPQGKKPIEHSWLIFQIDLEDKALPHLFFKPTGHSLAAYDRFFTAYNTLHIINDVFNTEHSPEFHSRYELYGNATHTLAIEKQLHSSITQTIAARFWPHAIEIFEGKLYVYITEHRLTETVLESTLEAASWLAAALYSQED